MLPKSQLAAAVLVALCSLVVALYFMTSKRPIAVKAKRNAIVVLGPSNAGKTALCLLLSGSKQSSVVSQESSTYSTSWGQVIDTPGLDKLEAGALAEISNARAVVFVVDATAPLKGAAHKLYKVLLLAQKLELPVLIAANKYDLFSTVSVAKVRTTLETEISQLRDAREKGLGEADEWLGSDQQFEFGQLDIQVEVLDGSVKAGRFGKWAQFVEKL